ncbi:MAG: hypothetical protein ABR955_01615 [Verrucomicrobiota bacterium]|jgi:hypothetical protein
MAIRIKWYLARDLEGCFPSLTRDLYHAVTIWPTKRYNCIAYAAGDKTRWWWPDPYGQYYWPLQKREETVDGFVQAFGLFRYTEQKNKFSTSEPNLEKVVIYYDPVGAFPATTPDMPTHAARQMVNGNWRSKLGPYQVIEHYTIECLNGNFPAYGEPVKILQRDRIGFFKRLFKIFSK